MDKLVPLLIGMALDALLGDPAWLPHPVVLIGKWIARCEAWLRRRMQNLRLAGFILTGSTLLLAALLTAAALTAAAALGKPAHLIVTSLICYLCLCAKTLWQEARMVKATLTKGLIEARQQVQRIVGRDTQSLSEQEIIAATVETVAENTVDGVLSPIFWYLLLGPVGMMLFKAASTLDSMVGYRNEKYIDLGFCGARLDDLMNYVPARLSLPLFYIASLFLPALDPKSAVRITLRDHQKHLSPNCAWPESFFAGALGVQLGGSHEYGGKIVEKPTLGDSVMPLSPRHITQSIALLQTVCALLFVLFFVLTLMI